MLMKTVLVCVALCSLDARAQESEEDFREVNISGQGRVRGYRAPGTDVYTFYSIPYATAPSGEDKFKAPLPPPTWNDTLEAVDKRIVCPQDPMSVQNMNMQEDCLIANILAPNTQQTNLSVLVVVHGGGFLLGYGNEGSMINLVNSKKIVVVNFNYRLGIHGFLCLWNEEAPGNAGLKDQVALLRWVKDNIAGFGGNPNDISVSGCSAGGSSVSLLMLSKLTDGLMHKIMPESGSNIGSLPVQFDPLQNAKDHALRLNFSNIDDIDALTKFYQGLSYDILLQDFGYLFRKDSTVVFTICVEKDIGQEIFLEEAPVNTLRNKNFKKLPTFVGFSSLEGAWRYNMFYEWKDLMNQKISDFLPSDLEFENETERELVAETIRKTYFGDRPVGNDTLLSFIDYFSDILFIQSILLSVRLQVEAGNAQVYLHEYSFTRIDRPAVPDRDFLGANHCDQTIAVMDEGDESLLPPDYQSMKSIMRELWLDFIIYGNPTPSGRNNSLPTWPPIGADLSPYYALGQILYVGDVPVQSRLLFWNELYEKYYRIPMEPSTAYIGCTISKTLFTFVLITLFLSKT